MNYAGTDFLPIPIDDKMLKKAFDRVVQIHSCNDGAEPKTFVSNIVTSDGEAGYRMGIAFNESPALSAAITAVQKTMDTLCAVFSDEGFPIEVDENGMSIFVADERIEAFFAFVCAAEDRSAKAARMEFRHRPPAPPAPQSRLN